MSAALWLTLLACYGQNTYPAGSDFSSPTFVPHDSQDWVFSSSRINRVELDVDLAAEQILDAQRRFSYPRDKVRVQAWIDGEPLGDIGLRVRGGLGSFTRFSDKPKLELDIHELSGERYEGLESLSLNNALEDCTSLREATGHAVHLQAGPLASRTGYAQVYVNGEDYGLYLVVETQDDRWLKANFDDRDGNLYDGKYQYKGMRPHFLDFGEDRDEWFDLEEVGFEDLRAVSEALVDSRERGEMSEARWELVDWPQVLTMLRAEQFTANFDGNAQGRNNYRVYFEPGEPMVLIPWDIDLSFPTALGGEADTGPVRVRFRPEAWEESPEGALLQVCLDDPACFALWDDIGEEVSGRLMDGSLAELTEQRAALIAAAALGDPRRDCDEGALEERGALLDYLRTGEAGLPADGGHGRELGDEDDGCSAAPGSPRWPLAVLVMLALAGRRRYDGRHAA